MLAHLVKDDEEILWMQPMHYEQIIHGTHHQYGDSVLFGEHGTSSEY